MNIKKISSVVMGIVMASSGILVIGPTLALADDGGHSNDNKVINNAPIVKVVDSSHSDSGDGSHAPAPVPVPAPVVPPVISKDDNNNNGSNATSSGSEIGDGNKGSNSGSGGNENQGEDQNENENENEGGGGHVIASVITDPATAITSSDAMLNGMNGPIAATGHSFWVSLAPFATSSSVIPAGVFSTPDMGAIAANTAFSSSLSSIATSGVPSNLPAIMPNTTYHFVAWSLVNGVWYPGAELSLITASSSSSLPGTLAAQDFGVVNYDTGLGILKGYTAGFGLTDATLASSTSVVVKLYAAGDVLLQTNTAILPKFNADITGVQFSSPFDVSGNFNYVADGYWTNVKEAQYGQSIPAVKVIATVTLANGKIVTAENDILTGDPTTIFLASGDVTPPSILFATNLGLSASSTSLIWVTNEASDSNLWISTVSPVSTSTAPVASSSSLSFFHQLSIPSLAPSTLYYYTVSSKDASGNIGYYSGSFTSPSI